MQNLASIQPRTRLVKFARSPRTDPLLLRIPQVQDSFAAANRPYLVADGLWEKPPQRVLGMNIEALIQELMEVLKIVPEVELRTPVNNSEYFPPNFEGLGLGCIDADFCK